ncbi:cytochrome P450 4C1-like [Planococcus citri]|uniref:cytochrome P450 4C1-like n=1 Tax=Planococcus citri TaxID=170843 RepID=UPI0031F804DB
MYILVILCSLIFAIFLSVVVFILALYNWRWPSHRKLCRKIPSPKMMSIFGVGLDLVRVKHAEILDYFGNLLKQHGPIVYIEYMGMSNVILSQPQDIELVLNNSQHISKGLEYRSILPWLCDGLLTSTGTKWHTRRKMLTPTFHFKILDNFIPIFNRNAKLLTKKLASASAECSAVDVDSYVSLCTLDIICETAMGMTLDFQLGEASEYVSAIKITGEIILRRSLTFWMTNDFFFNISPTGRQFRKSVGQLHQFTENVIKDRKAKYEPNYAYNEENEIGKQKQRKSFLDCLIEMQRENPNEMTDEGIREEVDTFMFEGHDTTSVAITWTLFMIACHEDVQAKLYEEMQQVFGDSDRDATYQDLQQFTYLEMVIKESLRLYPSVPYFSRLLTTELKIRDYIVPPNTNVSIIPYLVHRNTNIYPDPEKFIPERFLPQAAKERHPYAYIPFSAGYRNCIGQKFANLEEKVVISTVLRRLKLSTEMKKDELSVLPQVILRPFPKIKISFAPR